MELSAIHAALLCALALFLCTVLKKLVVKNPLDNLPGPPSTSFLSGNISRLLARDGWDFQLHILSNYGSVVNLKGLLNRPALYVYDAKALHNIIIKDQYVYEETPTFLLLNMLMFGPGLLATLGDHHRKQRKLLNPVFSVAHMRHMLPIFYSVVDKLRTAVTSRIDDGPANLDMLEWMGRTALELIGQGGLGHSFDPLVRDSADEFGQALKDLVPTAASLGVWRFTIPYIMRLGTPGIRGRLAKLVPIKRVQKLAKIIGTMNATSREILDSKRAALARGDEAVSKQVGQGKDIMSILIRANMEAKDEQDKLSEAELLAQISTLTFAAMDTTSNALSRMLHLLSQHQDVQQKLREEVLQSMKEHGSQLSYDELMGLPFLDAVCRETLRVYPPVTLLSRQARKDMVLPLAEPITGNNGDLMTELPIPSGTLFFIGTAGCNLNKAMWGDDALEWKPERWLSPLPASVTDARVPGVYSNLMTFLGGGRACIGFKFSEMEMKIVLAMLLSTFTFELTDKPIEWNMAGVRYPTMGKESNKPSMYLKVALYEGSTQENA